MKTFEITFTDGYKWSQTALDPLHAISLYLGSVEQPKPLSEIKSIVAI